MKIWAKLIDIGPKKNLTWWAQDIRIMQVREWECTDKDLPPGFIPEHGFVSLHDPTTGRYVGWCGCNWAKERIINEPPVKLPTKFQRTSINTESVYKHCQKYEMV